MSVYTSLRNIKHLAFPPSLIIIFISFDYAIKTLIFPKVVKYLKSIHCSSVYMSLFAFLIS